MIGKTVGHLRILSRLGEGGMGVVYLAEDTKLKRQVAVKTLPEAVAAVPGVLERFRREAKALAALNHPNIVTIYSVVDAEGHSLLEMELVRGKPLNEIIPVDGLPLGRYLELAIPLADALSAAHGHGVGHRDLKPSNILVTADWKPKILDFGLAKLRSHGREEEETATQGTSELTRPGMVLGTVMYMSPEQLQGQDFDHRSDIFSLGVIFYEMLTGARPFQGVSTAELISAILRDVPRPVTALRPELPRDLARIVRHCLEKDPERRYQTSKDLRNELEDLRDEQTAEETVARSGPVRGLRPAARRRSTLVGAAAVVAVALTALGLWVWRNNTPRSGGRAELAATATTAATPANESRRRLGILPPHNAAVNDRTEGWPQLIQALFAAELIGIDGFGVVDPLSLNGLLEGSPGAANLQAVRGPALYRSLAPLRLDLVLDGVISVGPDGERLVAHLVDVDSGEVSFSTDVVEVSGEVGLTAAVEAMARQILSYLQVSQGLARDKDLRPWMTTRRQDPEATKAFMRAAQYIYRREPGYRTHLERAVAIDPEFVAPRVWLISGLVQAGEREEAERHLRYLAGIEAQAGPFDQAMIGWAGAFLRQDLAGQALHLEMALQYSPGNNILLFNLGLVRALLGDCQRALEAVAPALEARWEFPDLYSLAGECHIRLGQIESASRVLEESLRLPGVSPEVYGMLEGVALAAGDTTGASRFNERYRGRLEETRPFTVAETLGSIYSSLGNRCLEARAFDRATALFRRAIEEQPEAADHQAGLGEALYGAADLDGAATAFERAAALDREDPRARLRLGMIREESGDSAGARLAYQEVLSVAPGTAESQQAAERLRRLEVEGRQR